MTKKGPAMGSGAIEPKSDRGIMEQAQKQCPRFAESRLDIGQFRRLPGPGNCMNRLENRHLESAAPGFHGYL